MITHTSVRISIGNVLLYSLFLFSFLYAEHPRLFFSAAEIPQLQQKAQSTHSEIYKPIKDYADQLIGTTPAEYPSSPSYSPFRDGGNMLIPMAFAYVITGDTKYADITKIYLEGYLKWPTWGGSSSFEERDLALAFMIMGNAIAYDWIYDVLEDSLQVAVKNKIAHHATEMYEAATSHWTSGWNNWWGWSYAQNHWHINNNAIALAAFALEGEADSTDVWIDHITHQFAIDSFVVEGVNDGSWHESIQYHNARMTLSLPTYYNLKRLKSRDLLPETYLNNFVYWSLYNHLPGTNRAALTFSSYVPPWGEGILTGLHGILRFIAAEYDNGHAEWLTQQVIDISGRYPNVYNAPYYVFEFFYYDPSVNPVPPDDLPLDRTFSDIECVIWRTGWETDDLVFGLKCGAYGGKYFRDQFLAEAYPFDDTNSMLQINVGHDQPDAGTFYLYKSPVDLASEMPDRHREGTGFHNTILVDGREQYQAVNHAAIAKDTDGKLDAVYTTPNYNFLIADATDRYRDKIDDNTPGDWLINEFKRYVLFVKPSYLIMVDNLRSSETHRYDWICHFSDDTTGSITVEDDWIKGAANATDILGIKILSPDTFIDTMGYSVPVNYTTNKPYIRIRPAQNVDNTQFITVLFPTTASSWSSKPDFMLSEHTDKAASVHMLVVGANVTHFINYSSDKKVTIGEYILSGSAASVIKTVPDKMMELFLGGGDTLADSSGSRIILQSPRNITVEAVYDNAKLSLYGDSLQGVKIYGPEIDNTQVTVNDVSVPAMKEGNYIIVGDYVGIQNHFNKNIMIKCKNMLYSTRPHILVSFIPIKSGVIYFRIYSMHGRLIWKAEKVVMKGRESSVSWYGKNHRGQKVGNGTYIVHMKGSGVNFVQKVSVVQ